MISVSVLKNVSCFCQFWSEISLQVLPEYIAVLTNAICYAVHQDYSIIVQQGSALARGACNTVQQAQCETLTFIVPKL